MATLDHRIFLQQQAPDFAGNFQQGLKMGDLIRKRKEDRAVKDIFRRNTVEGEDGSPTLDRKATLADLYKVRPEMAAKMESQFQAQDAQKQKAEYEDTIQKLDVTGRYLGAVTDQQSYDQAVNELVGLGIAEPGDFPPQFDQGWLRQAQMRTMSIKDQMAQQMGQKEFALKEQELGLKRQKAATEMGGPGTAGEVSQKRLSAMYGKPPAHYRWTPDGQLEEIPGGKAESQKAQRAQSITSAGQTVIRDISTAIETIDKAGSRAAGWGAWFDWLPESAAKDLKADIASIQGNVAVDQLLKIKQQGSGLGQVPQSQLEMLASLVGGLDRAMSPSKLKQNLQDIKDIYADIVKAEGGDPFEMAERRGFERPVPMGGERGGMDGLFLKEPDEMSDEELDQFLGR